jgi:hypothetical protein
MDLGKRVNVVVHDKKFVFMMLKKCASVTMGKIILESLGYKNLRGDNVNKVIRKLGCPNRYEVDALDYTKLVWVRNPFNRLVSGWFDRVRRQPNAKIMKWYGIPNTISFPDFVDWVCSIDDPHMNTHFRQQTSDITIDGRLVPNVVMKLENLNEEWKELQHVHDWLVDIKYHAHKSKKGNYRDYYTDDLIKKVEIRFKDDLRLLDYSFV